MFINNGVTLLNGFCVAPPGATAPDAPIIGTAVATSATSAFVPFTAPANDGQSIITSYVATSNPSNIANTIFQSGSGGIPINGLTELTSYTFTIIANNGLGSSSPSSISNSITTPSSKFIPVNTDLPVVSGIPNFGQTLSLSNGTWAANPSPTYTYQWQRNTSNISGATGNTYDIIQADVGSTLRGIVIATNSEGNASATSSSTATVSALVPSAPTIGTSTTTGLTTATVTYTASSSNGGANITTYTATSSPGNITATISQAGSGTINVTGLSSGISYTFTVTATNSVGTSNASSASNSITTFTTPVNTVPPVVSGTQQFGSTLSCTTGTWTGTAPITYTYQWQRAGTNINTATSSTYTLVQSDVGTTIRCVVTGTNNYGNSSATSNPTSNIIAIAPGTPTVGATTATGLSSATVAFTAPASNGGATITTYTATSSPGGVTGTLNQAESGTITVNGLSSGVSYTFTVTATNSAGTSNASSASSSITTFTIPVNTVAPVVSGTANFGSTLSCTTGTWTGTATISYTYQWQRTGVNISSATSSTYTLVAADVGSAISCVVTGTNSYGASSANSNATSYILPIVPGAPTIGTATTVSTTSATVTFTAPASNGGATITTYTATSSPGNITGTLSQSGSGTITVSGLTQGTSYTFTVTATNSAGTSSPSSASNSIVTGVIPSNTVAPVVSGTQSFGSTLSCTTGTWTGSAPITYTYQWQRAGTNISLATSSTYTLVETDVGTTIRCVVTGTNSYGASSANSNSTSSISAIAPGSPTIGTATVTGLTTATVAFTAPASNGGKTIQSYTATSSPGNLTGTLNQAGSGTITVSGLTQGTNYTFTVTATNGSFTSSPSSASNSITTYATPVNTVAPVVSGTQSFGSTLSCTTGTWTGTATITYAYQWQRNGANIASATSNTYTLVQADVFNIIRCVVTGTNSYGTSSANSNATSYISPTVPGVPTIGTATPTGLTSATLTYTAPASNGGATITSYTGISNVGNITSTLNQSGSGTIPFYGLTSGTSYTFTVIATNTAGNSSPSSASNSITTFSAPVNTVAPVVSGTETFGSTLSCTTGTWTGSATITYAYRWQRNGVNIASATSSTYTLVQSDVNSVIRCVVTGTNSYGNSSANSNSTLDILPIAPGAPTIGTATPAGSTRATVTFTAPASNGGDTITTYTATSSPGNITGTLSQAGSGTITVNGLTTGTTYTFTVTATNSAGVSSPSSASNSITLLPSTPTVDYLVVAGGGGGGGGCARPSGSGGGGAGGYRTGTSFAVSSGVGISITVGSGGTAGSSAGSSGGKGSDSLFSSITSTGGGFGSGTYIYGPSTAAPNGSGTGGSGGGGSGSFIPGSGSSGNTPATTPRQGYDGAGGTQTSPFVGGGGGGAGGGGTTSGSRTGGGPGASSSITGSAVTYASGGNNGVGSTYLGGVSGTSGTGNGGGGASSIQGIGMPGGSGGSGTVVIRYPDTYSVPFATVGNPTVTVTGGYRIYRWTSSGSITF